MPTQTSTKADSEVMEISPTKESKPINQQNYSPNLPPLQQNIQDPLETLIQNPNLLDNDLIKTLIQQLNMNPDQLLDPYVMQMLGTGNQGVDMASYQKALEELMKVAPNPQDMSYFQGSFK